MTAAPALSPSEQVVASWRAGVLSLPEDRIPAPGLLWFEPGPRGRPGVWTAVRAAMLRFLDEWGAEAARVGWSTESLFGVHGVKGALRADSTGAMVSNYPYSVLALDASSIVLGRRGARLTFRGLTNPAESIPLWRFRSTT